MRLEAFTEAKAHGAPDTNEDALLVLPGRAYAVADGATDRVGTRYGGMLSGRYASRLIVATLEALLAPAGAPLHDPWAAVEAATGALHAVYDAQGITEAVRADWNRQMAATLALVTLTDEHAHVLLLGDSGVRLNGAAVWQETKDVDTITSTLRATAWAAVAPRTADPAERERVSRAVCWSGAAYAGTLAAPFLGKPDLRAIADETVARCRTLLPHLPEDAIAAVVAGGIVHAQGGHQNNPASPLGYPSLNGFPVPRPMVRVETVPRAGLHTLELFTDGYFAPGRTFGVDAWEERFGEVEREDPHKIGPFASPKGTTAAQWADDRTYLGVAF